MHLNKSEDLLGKGFELAYFLAPNRPIAIQILSAAMSKLEAQRSREKKRAYWRDKYLKRKITRIVREDGDLLQWLIYFEAEDYEKQQEQLGEQTARDLVIRYVKYLVQLTTAMSSFYVNVGLHRLLHNYSTSEVRKVYEAMTQHYPGDQEYRKVKATLMKRLERRFKNLIKTFTAQYGEVRFEAVEHQDSWKELVDRCLRAFTPWSTAKACGLLSKVEKHDETLPFPISEKRAGGSVDQDIVEAYRCHVLIEPSCYEWLTKRFGLDPPHSRLAVPRFFLTQNSDHWKGSENGREKPLDLTEQERQRILDRLAADSRRRKRISPTFLRIAADGEDCIRLDGNRSGGTFEVEDGAKLIEVWTEDEGGRLLLATHWIDYTHSQVIAASTATVNLGSGSELLLETVPRTESMEQPGGASISVKWQPISSLQAVRQLFPNPPMWFQRVPKLAFVPLLLLAIAGIFGTVKYSREVTRQREASERLARELAREKAARASEHAPTSEQGDFVQSLLLVPDDLRIRGPQGTREPVISLSSHVPVVVLELPIDGNDQESYRTVLKPFLEGGSVLTEDFPKSAQLPTHDKLKFAVPATFLEDAKHYVVTLNRVGSTGKITQVRKFTFYVQKQ